MWCNHGVLVAVVVSYRAAPDMLDTCVASLVDGGGVDRVVVVDNGGLARPRLHDGAVEVLLRSDNPGYGGGVNAGVARARELGAELVAVLNDDVRVEPSWLAPILDVFDDDPTIGVVQPILATEGSDPAEVNSAGVRLDRFGQGSDLHRGEPVDAVRAEGDAVRALEIFTGGCFVARMSFFKETGGFDESLFLYYEDVDLARRGARRGWRYALAANSLVWHHGSATTSARPDFARGFQERNRLWNLARHESAGAFARGLWLSVRRLRHEPRSVHARALRDGLRRVPGALIARLRQRRL